MRVNRDSAHGVRYSRAQSNRVERSLENRHRRVLDGSSRGAEAIQFSGLQGRVVLLDHPGQDRRIQAESRCEFGDRISMLDVAAHRRNVRCLPGPSQMFLSKITMVESGSS